MKGDSDVGAEIVRVISDRGPIPFSTYMNLALYHREFGYYARNVPSADSDYRTSPSTSPWFGMLLTRLLEDMWTALEQPREFKVFEFGAGAGDLAAACVDGSSPPLRSALQWCFIEPFPHPARIQEERVAGIGGRFEWHKSMPEGSHIGCVLANEVLDNFPVDVYEITQHGVSEVLIAADSQELREELRPLPKGDLTAFNEQLAHLSAGDRFEMRLGVHEWCRSVSDALEAGHMLVFDYGDERPTLWTNHPAGTLVTYSSNGLGLDPLSAPRDTDITSHVDFSELQSEAEAAGFSKGHLIPQRDLLNTLGAGRVIDDLRAQMEKARLEGDHSTFVSKVAERSKLGALVAPAALGGLIAYIAAKNCPVDLTIIPRASRRLSTEAPKRTSRN